MAHCLMTCVLAPVVHADDPPVEIASFLSDNCTACHDASTSEGDLNLESLLLELKDPDNFQRWQRVFDRVTDGEMPPDETLETDHSSEFLTSLHEILDTSDSERISAFGRVPARRLTRSQYERNVCELLAINIPLSEYLPEDSLTNGFATVSNSQQISDHSMAAYLQAADVALNASFNQILNDVSPSKTRLEWRRLARDENDTNRDPEGRPAHQDAVSWSTIQNFYGRMAATTVEESGHYRIRILVKSVNASSEKPIWCSVKSGVCSAKASTLHWIASFEATNEPTEHVFEAWIHKGHMLQIRPRDQGLKKAPVPVVRGPAGVIEQMGVPGVAIKWIDIERIDSANERVRQVLIGDLPLRPIVTKTSAGNPRSYHRFQIQTDHPKQDLQKLIHAFAKRAFRRPVTQAELTPYVKFSESRLAAGGSMYEALRAAYRAILCSSRFLYFEEAPGKLDAHAIANRLSHFLWGKAPDQQLRDLADSGQLNDSSVLREQTERLLNDSRSDTFINEFTDQWLMLYEINSTTPDGKLYPEYDDVLHHSLVQETHAFVRELVDNDLPVSNVVDSDFTFVNSRLARHYNIEWPGGTGLQKVKLAPSSRRGGIITHASVLKVTANGTATSPIIRGVWMLDRIMGIHVPPPPANVPAVEPDIRGATSIRDQLNKHKQLESCAACHVKIDPPGFALESYDVIGGWRDHYRTAVAEKRRKWSDGLPVDPSHEMVGGKTFDDIEGLKAIVTADPKQLAINLASHLVSCSTGAAPTYADRETIETIVKAAGSKKYGVRSLVHEVIQSSLFKEK